MVTVAIIGIFAAIAFPQMRTQIENSDVNGQVNAFVGTFNAARSEAIKYNAIVVLCASADAGTALEPSCADATDKGAWKTGWMAFLDRNNSGDLDTSAGDVLLSAQGTFKKTGGISTNGANPLKFYPNGLLSQGFGTFTFESASKIDGIKRCVTVSKAGRTQVQRGSDCS